MSAHLSPCVSRSEAHHFGQEIIAAREKKESIQTGDDIKTQFSTSAFFCVLLWFSVVFCVLLFFRQRQHGARSGLNRGVGMTGGKLTSKTIWSF